MCLDWNSHVLIRDVWGDILVFSCFISDLTRLQRSLIRVHCWCLDSRILSLWRTLARFFIDCTYQSFRAQKILDSLTFLVGLRVVHGLLQSAVIGIRYQRNINSKTWVPIFRGLVSHWRILWLLSWKKRILISRVICWSSSLEFEGSALEIF